jgi:peptide/nickel transport system substrate-binding protein
MQKVVKKGSQTIHGILWLILVVGLLILGAGDGQAAPAGELRIAMGMLGNEQLQHVTSAGTGNVYLNLIYDVLVGASPNGGVDKKNGLAENWQMSSDAKTWTFSLRRGVKFHNGDEVTAEDVKFSIERVLGPLGVAAPNHDDWAKMIDSMEVVSHYKLVVRCKIPSPFLNLYLSNASSSAAGIVPKKYIEANGEKHFAAHPIGSGPYKFLEQVTGSHILLQAVEKHWRVGVPKYATIRWLLVPEESSRVAYLKTGKADIIEASRSKVDELKQAGFNIVQKDGAYGIWMVFTEQWLEGSALGNKKVRQALNLAIDRASILKNIFKGAGKLTGNAPSLSWGVGFTPMTAYPYDPSKARALLAEAGFAQGLNMRIVSAPRPGLPENANMHQAVAAMWEAIGVRTTIEPMDYGAARNLWTKKKFGPNTVMGFDMGNRSWILPMYGSLCTCEGNLPSFCNPAFDKMQKDALTTIDPKEFMKKMASLQKMIWEDYNLIPMAEVSDIYATTKDIPAWPSTKVAYDMGIEYLIGKK